jgi:hypothetical protein
MPHDPNLYLIISCFSLAAIGMIAFVSLRGWRDWIALKHAELENHRPDPVATPSATSRIEVADLKERVKKLEAIAAGIDL